MAQDTKWSVHDNIWNFSVTEPQLHRKGYTIYKVTCQTFPIRSPEALTELICWKRYNDFKTLHKALLALHKALHRKDQFPEFAKPKLFGRFDDTVIEERRLSAVQLLNFVATQPHLYKSLVFKQFLEDGKSRSESIKKAVVMTPHPSSLNILHSQPKKDASSSLHCVADSSTVENKMYLEGPQPLAHSNHTAEAGCNGSTSNISKSAMLEGTWQFPQVADNISLDSSTGDETIDTDDDSVLTGSLPDADLAFFEHSGHEVALTSPDDLSSSVNNSNSWLLAGLNMCADLESDEVEGNVDNAAVTPVDPEHSRSDTMMSTESTITNFSALSSTSTLAKLSDQESCGAGSRKDSLSSSGFVTSQEFGEFDPIRKMSQSSDSAKVECGKGDLDLSAEWQVRSSSFSSHTSVGTQRSTTVDERQPDLKSLDMDRPNSGISSRSQSVSSEKSQDSEKASSNKSTPSRTSRSLLKRFVSGSPSHKKPRSATEQSVSTMDLGGKEDYIYLAASQISMAQNSEANGDFEVAFAYYKSGVGILLQGVQGDTNKSRRDAVRRKTAQYLMKAEDLFNRHLATENVDERRWGADSFLSPSLDLDPSFAFIRGPAKELRSYQVLGTIDKVILVRDKATDETFIFKSIPKSIPDGARTQSILPTSCPHMVSLHKFYETDDSVFLLLQYASGGKLWTYIGDYLNSDQGNAGIELDVVRAKTDKMNIYSGTKVENNSNADSQLTSGQQNGDLGDLSKNGEVGSNVLDRNEQYKHSFKGHEAGTVRYSSLIIEDTDMQTVHSSGSANVEVGNIDTNIEDGDEIHDAELTDLLNYSLRKQPLNRRFSSLSDDCAQVNENDSSVISPTILPEEDPFQTILQEHRSNLEAFSINSFDSEDTQRLSLSFREKIDSIPEDTDTSSSPAKLMTTRQISADEVFTSARREARHSDMKVRHASTDGAFFHAIDMPDNCADIVLNSKKLIEQVEIVLKETENRAGEEGFVGDPENSAEKNCDRVSNISNDSAEEPSIYDNNKSSGDESSEFIANGTSQVTLDSPTVNSSVSSGLALTDDKSVFKADEISDADKMSSSGSTNTKSSTVSSVKSSIFRQTSTPHKLSISRMNSKDMIRSASFECDLKSPTRNRARTVTDLFERLDSANCEKVQIPETSIRKWMAQLVTAVSRLHSLGIICRDLKPSNVLLGDGGQVYLTYFCYLGHDDFNLDWEAVQNLYAAPEVGSIHGYDKSCDWWSIGALLYELIVGKTLAECHPGGINSHTCLYVPTFVSSEARGLLEGLLKHNPHERLGSGIAGSEEIKAHPFFAGVDWHSLEYS
ncbi:ribosomal protein S6 kinase delta-1-like [Physella acuta]|uniref:ribosomal protein S6 kinase delta-1-like n=1 Tax=Physella acuta TaxID=109671 RepID=UPI0027DBC9BF|nr:ribosomal protein S6 kinase delta-1-like [Physella acuta]